MHFIEKHKFPINGINKRNFSLIILLIITASVSYCQQLPNFSGDWILNLNKSKLQADWTTGLTNGIIKIVHNEPDFSFWRSFTIKGEDKIVSYEIQTNGLEQKDEHNAILILTWKQDTLLLVVRYNHNASNKVKYYLSANTMELTAEEKVESPDVSYHNLWILDKKSQPGN